jgi:hypothetical protein
VIAFAVVVEVVVFILVLPVVAAENAAGVVVATDTVDGTAGV